MQNDESCRRLTITFNNNAAYDLRFLKKRYLYKESAGLSVNRRPSFTCIPLVKVVCGVLKISSCR